jgi:hypothetical protein
MPKHSLLTYSPTYMARLNRVPTVGANRYTVHSSKASILAGVCISHDCSKGHSLLIVLSALQHKRQLDNHASILTVCPPSPLTETCGPTRMQSPLEAPAAAGRLLGPSQQLPTLDWLDTPLQQTGGLHMLSHPWHLGVGAFEQAPPPTGHTCIPGRCKCISSRHNANRHATLVQRCSGHLL